VLSTSMKLQEEAGDESPVDVLVREFEVQRIAEWSVRADGRCSSPNGRRHSGQSVDGILEVFPVQSEQTLSGMVAVRRRPSREVAECVPPAHAPLQPRAPRMRPSREELDLPDTSSRLRGLLAISDAEQQAWLSAEACSTPITCEEAA